MSAEKSSDITISNVNNGLIDVFPTEFHTNVWPIFYGRRYRQPGICPWNPLLQYYIDDDLQHSIPDDITYFAHLRSDEMNDWLNIHNISPACQLLARLQQIYQLLLTNYKLSSIQTLVLADNIFWSEQYWHQPINILLGFLNLTENKLHAGVAILNELQVANMNEFSLRLYLRAADLAQKASEKQSDSDDYLQLDMKMAHIQPKQNNIELTDINSSRYEWLKNNTIFNICAQIYNSQSIQQLINIPQPLEIEYYIQHRHDAEIISQLGMVLPKGANYEQYVVANIADYVMIARRVNKQINIIFPNLAATDVATIEKYMYVAKDEELFTWFNASVVYTSRNEIVTNLLQLLDSANYSLFWRDNELYYGNIYDNMIIKQIDVDNKILYDLYQRYVYQYIEDN